MQYVLLVVSFALLLLGAVGFTNAVEWAGHKLGLGAGAVGSVLAAISTALPESMIPMVAIISGAEGGQVAIGAILGAPFLLGTLAMALVGLSSHGYKERRDQGKRLEPHRPSTMRDLVVFLVCLGGALVLGVVGNKPVHVVAAVLLVVAYVVYVWRSVKSGGETQDESQLKALYLDRSKRDEPRGSLVGLQLAMSLAAIVGGAQVFVTVIEHLSKALGVSALVLALVLAPLATELPEKANSFLWVRRGKDALALGNITGAMVFQSMLPVAVGLAFTPWQLEGYALGAGACALVGGAVALVAVRRSNRFRAPVIGLWAVLYAGFVAAVIGTS